VYNLVACFVAAGVLGLLAVYHAGRGSLPGWRTLGLVTLITSAFLVRGEANWRAIVAATRAATARAPRDGS
jgi:hypothetical protein